MRTLNARLMIYCQDSLGLGHLRRNVNIAHEVARAAPETSVVFVSDSPMSPFFDLPPNCDFVKLPTVVKVRKGDWEVHRLPHLGAAHVREIRSRLIRDLADAFRPDVLLVDHMPHGAAGELAPCLASLRRSHAACRRVLGLRDILGAPVDICSKWRDLGAYELLGEHYDAVLVYGSREVFDVAEAYAFGPEIARRVRYCGYVAVAPEASCPAPDRLSEKFEVPRAQTALVMAGGGHDGFAFMDTVLDAIRWIGPEIPFNSYVVTGPFMPAEERHALEQKARGLPVAVRRFRDDSATLMRAADLVVAMAGYNTTCEVLQLARRAILVPREGPSLEQSMRTERFQQRGWLHAIHPSALSAPILGEAMLKELAGPERDAAAAAIDLSGAARAAGHVLELAASARRSARASQ